MIEKIQTRFPQSGHGSITVLLKPDCYVDYEQEVTASFEVFPPRTDQTLFMHPEDAEVIKRPTLFNQLAAQLKNDNDSDEEEEVDPNEDHNKPQMHNHHNCGHDHDHEEEEEEVVEEAVEEK